MMPVSSVAFLTLVVCPVRPIRLLQLVLYTFADGVDLDFEHLSTFEGTFGDELAYFSTFINALRTELDTVVIPAWVTSAQDRAKLLTDMYADAF